MWIQWSAAEVGHDGKGLFLFYSFYFFIWEDLYWLGDLPAGGWNHPEAFPHMSRVTQKAKKDC